MTVLSDNIRAYREQMGCTQEELCELTGVSRQSLHKHESGKIKPSSETLAIYARVLGVDVNKLQTQLHPDTWNFTVYDSLQWNKR